jgi:hypothetical protein
MFRCRGRWPGVVVSLVVLQGVAASAEGGHGVPMWMSEPARDMEKKTVAELRYPQPVRVGDLTDRLVLDPTGRQRVLGRIDHLQRGPGGELEIVVRYGGIWGGIWGLGSRKIAVPAHTTTLLGQFLQIVDLDRATLDALPTWTGDGASAVPPEEQVEIGINRN